MECGRWKDKRYVYGTYELPTSPKYAFSFATSGGLKLDWAWGKYCMAGIVAVGLSYRCY